MSELASPLPVKGFSHVCIRVSDIERSLDFYRAVLGFDTVFDVELDGPSLEAVTGEPGAKGRMIGGLLGGTMVELICYGHRSVDQVQGRGLGYSNISLSVDDLDAAYADAIAHDVPTLGEPVEIAGVRMFFVLDPDSTPIEIISYPNGGTTSLSLWRTQSTAT